MKEIAHYYWDTCIFVAFLNKMVDAYGPYVDQIGQFLEEAKKGECRIYTSGITIAEMPKKRLIASRYGEFSEFLADYAGAITPIGTDPNVMMTAADIKNLSYSKTGGTREVGTADAIHLASALALVEDYGVSLTAFHTFDDGKGKGLEGKAVSLLSYETWCGECINDPVAQRIIGLTRKRPDHPYPKLPMPLPIVSRSGVPTPGPEVPPAMPGTMPVAAAQQNGIDMALIERLPARTIPEVQAFSPTLSIPAPDPARPSPDASGQPTRDQVDGGPKQTSSSGTSPVQVIEVAVAPSEETVRGKDH